MAIDATQDWWGSMAPQGETAQKPGAELVDPTRFRYRAHAQLEKRGRTVQPRATQEWALRTFFLGPPNSCATVDSQRLTLRVSSNPPQHGTCGANHQLSGKSTTPLRAVKAFTHRRQICADGRRLPNPLGAPVRPDAAAGFRGHSRTGSTPSRHIFHVPHRLLDPWRFVP